MDTRRLTEIEERCEKATTGEWRHVPDDNNYRNAWGIVWGLRGQGYGSIASTASSGMCYALGEIEQKTADAAFIAHARTDLPDLLAYCKSLRAEAAELARALEALKNKTEAIAKAVDPYISLASIRSGKDLYDGGPTMQPEVDRARELLSRPTVVELMKEKD